MLSPEYQLHHPVPPDDALQHQSAIVNVLLDGRPIEDDAPPWIPQDAPDTYLATVGDGQVVGAAVVTVQGHTSEDTTRFATVEALAVSPEHRRAGIARTLVTWAIANALADGATETHVTAAHRDDAALAVAKEFYAALGFRQTGLDPSFMTMSLDTMRRLADGTTQIAD